MVIEITRSAHLGFNVTPIRQRRFTSRLGNDDVSEIAGHDCVDLASYLQKFADNAERFVGLVSETLVDLPLKLDAFRVMRFGGGETQLEGIRYQKTKNVDGELMRGWIAQATADRFAANVLLVIEQIKASGARSFARYSQRALTRAASRLNIC